MSDRIKVAFVIDRIEYQAGGTERQLVMLLEHINREKFDIYLCCLDGSGWLADNAGLCPSFVVGFRSFYSPRSWWRWWRFSRILRNKKIDIVYTFFRDANIVGTIAARVAGVPAVISARRNMGYWHNRTELLLLRLLNRVTTRYIANSFSVKTHTAHVEGIPLDKIDVIYNGVNLRPYEESSRSRAIAFRDELGIPADAPVAVCVANLRPVKGLSDLIQASARVIESIPEFRLLLVGEGDERAALTGLAGKLGISTSVSFLGTRTDVPDILGVANVAVLSSLSEGLSNSIIEYMVAGLPVVATSVGGNGELVIDGKNGFLVSKGNPEQLAGALVNILSNPDQARAFGAASRSAAVSLFSLDSCIQSTESVFHEVAAKS